MIRFWILAATIVLATFRGVLASVPVISIAGTSEQIVDQDRVVAYEFRANHEITVTDLGKFDANKNGVLDDIVAPLVGIWNAQTGDLISSTSIDVSTPAEHGVFFSPIPPTTLPTGNYIIGVQAFDDQEPYVDRSLVATSNAIERVRGWYSSGSEFAFPTRRRSLSSHLGPSFKIDEPLALFGPGDRSIFQRDAHNVAQIPINGFVSDEVTRVEARAVVMDGFWGTNTPWQSINHENGAFESQLPVPAGGWYRIEANAFSDDQLLGQQSLERIGVGEVFITAGGANSANFGEALLESKHDQVSAMAANGQWRHAKDSQPIAGGSLGSPWPVLGDLLVEKHQVPIGFVSIGLGGTPVDEWLPENNAAYRRFEDALQLLGPFGFRGVLWHKSELFGETTPSEYARILPEIISQFRQDAGGQIPWFQALTGTTTRGQREVIEGYPLVIRGALALDLTGQKWLRDGYHFTEAGQHEYGRRWADVISRFLRPDAAPGDLNADGLLGVEDIDELDRQIRFVHLYETEFDLNNDGVVDDVDRTTWIEELVGSYFGDANLDGEFNSSDLVSVFEAGEFEDRRRRNSNWATGDWNGDFDFDSDDLVLAFQRGGYELGPQEVVQVPEPPSILFLAMILLSIWRRRDFLESAFRGAMSNVARHK